PIKIAAFAANRLGIPFPISPDNIRGMETVRRMETRESFARIGMTPATLSEALARVRGNKVGSSDFKSQSTESQSRSTDFESRRDSESKIEISKIAPPDSQYITRTRQSAIRNPQSAIAPRFILIGAGKVGVIHALNLTQRA